MVTVGNGAVPGQADGLALVLATISVCVHFFFTLLVHLIPVKREKRIVRGTVGERENKENKTDSDRLRR